MIKLDYSLIVTILYVIGLYAFMNHFFFRPISRVLHERRQLIEGRLQAAHQSVLDVDKKTAEYEQTLKTARTEIFRRQETQREHALAERAELLQSAEAEASKTVQEVRTRLHTEAEIASRKLGGEVMVLAQELTTALLRNKS